MGNKTSKKCEPCKFNFPPNFTLTPGVINLLNPGNFSSIHKNARNIMPIWLDGCQFSFVKPFSPVKFLTASWILSERHPSGFRIGYQYSVPYDTNKFCTPSIKADINPSTLATNLSILYHPIPEVRLEINTETSQVAKNAQMTLEYIGKSSTSTVNIYDPTKDSGKITLAYLQSVSSHFSIGQEFYFEWNKGKVFAQTALAARYCRNNAVTALTLSPLALDMTHWRLLKKGVQLGTSLVFNKQTSEALGSVFYQYDFKKSYIRGMFDSDGGIGFTYNRQVSKMNLNFGLSLLYSMSTNRFISGFQIELSPFTERK